MRLDDVAGEIGHYHDLGMRLVEAVPIFHVDIFIVKWAWGG